MIAFLAELNGLQLGNRRIPMLASKRLAETKSVFYKLLAPEFWRQSKGHVAGDN
jgi:hypothetical protein